MGIKGRVIVWVIGLIFGIPTSIYGVQWMQYKFLKQEVDCITDVNDAMLNFLSNVEQGSGSREMGKINNNLRTCVKNIDPRKGSVEFAVEQYKRYH
ncbi:hypothetical protein N7922_13850 [Kosakonia sp. ML.JS2a]|uniref:hypothetical protein n=1 Tax=Kosakonia sp. ML.JS2a TaxID=2980557 RepID=UPI0021DB39CC|nr:hypothetical protein [Kosakonia sp. ML.JS2a]UXY08975.1 hypothetical protein N7922_13850 [Kosakonia sp. ML.JS2a]